MTDGNNYRWKPVRNKIAGERGLRFIEKKTNKKKQDLLIKKQKEAKP